MRAAYPEDRAVEARAQMQRGRVVLRNVLGPTDVGRGRERRGVGGAKVAREREGVGDAALNRPPEASQGRPIQVLLVAVGAKLGQQLIREVGAASRDRAGRKAERDDRQRVPMPRRQRAARRCEHVHTPLARHRRWTGEHVLGVGVEGAQRCWRQAGWMLRVSRQLRGVAAGRPRRTARRCSAACQRRRCSSVVTSRGGTGVGRPFSSVAT